MIGKNLWSVTELQECSFYFDKRFPFIISKKITKILAGTGNVYRTKMCIAFERKGHQKKKIVFIL